MLLLVMGSHGVFHACVRVVGVLHGDVAIAVAKLGRCYGRARQALLRVQAALVLVVLEPGGRLRLGLGLLAARVVVVVSGSHLAIAIESARPTGGIRVRLPLIHGCGCRARERGEGRREGVTQDAGSAMLW